MFLKNTQRNRSFTKIKSSSIRIFITTVKKLINEPFFRLNVRLNRARTRPMQTRLLGRFAIQIEHKPERGKPSTAFEAASLFLAVKDKIWSFGIIALVESDTEEIVVLYLYAKQRRKRKGRVSVHTR